MWVYIWESSWMVLPWVLLLLTLLVLWSVLGRCFGIHHATSRHRHRLLLGRRCMHTNNRLLVLDKLLILLHMMRCLLLHGGLLLGWPLSLATVVWLLMGHRLLRLQARSWYLW